jgi:hypothetical protein
VPTPADAMKKPLEMGYWLMLVSERADGATAKGDHLLAAKYWSALAKAVPDRSLSFSKACKSYEAGRDLVHALEACRAALGKSGVTVEDNQRFVKLVLDQQGKLSAMDIADVDAIADHLQEQLKDQQGELLASRMRCQIANRLAEAKRMHACVDKLQALAPNDPQTLVFAWTSAMLDNDLKRANVALDTAARAHLAPESLERMRAAVDAQRAAARYAWLRSLRDPKARYVWLLVCLGVAALAFAVVRKRRVPSA